MFRFDCSQFSNFLNKFLLYFPHNLETFVIIIIIISSEITLHWSRTPIELSKRKAKVLCSSWGERAY